METSQEITEMGLAHLIDQTSGVGLIPAVLLLIMSVATWYWILLKVWQSWKTRRDTREFL